MAVKIQIKRGTKAGLPALAPGEWGLATDTGEVFIGGASGNIRVATLDSNGKIPGGNLDLSGYVPSTRKVNGKALSGDITLTAADVGALPLEGGIATGELKYNGDIASMPQEWSQETLVTKKFVEVLLSQAAPASALAAYDKTIKDTYPIATGNSVTAGDVVDVVNGEVTKSVVAEPNAIINFQTSLKHTTMAPVKKLSDKYSLTAVWYTSGTSVFVLDLLIIDNKNNTTIYRKNLYSGSSDIISYISIAVLTPNHAVVSYYKYGTQVVSVQISDDGIITSVGNEYGASGSLIGATCEAVDDDKVILFGNLDNYLYSVVLSVSTSNTFTVLKSAYVLSNQYPAYVSAVQLSDSTAAERRFLVSYRNTNSGNIACLILSFDSIYTMTTGSTISITASTYAPSVVLTDSGMVAITWVNSNSSTQYVEILTISGLTITRGAALSIGSNNRNVTAIAFVNGKLVVGATTTNTNTAALLSISGTTLTKVQDYVFTGDYVGASCCFCQNENQIIVVFGASSGFYLTTLTVSGNQIAGGFTVNSTQAIALESGEAGQEIEVIFAGTTAADFITEGQKIPSEGVYGYGPMTGWLNVIPYWAKEAGAKIVMGSYVGTGRGGQSNPNRLTFPFEPKFIYIYQVEASSSSQMFCGIGQTHSFVSFADTSTTAQLYRYASVIDLSGKQMSWWNDSDSAQLNVSGSKYLYLAIG